MHSITTNTNITISYQDTGDKSAATIILIMGLGAQMTAWPDELYYGLVNKGFRVIRFDNRDAGLSSQLEHLGKPSVIKSWLSKRASPFGKAPYLLDDMADDVLALMVALKVKKAHLVGASMGGMIAQLLAAKHNKKVLSLTSIMSGSTSATLSTKTLSTMLKLAKLKPRQSNKEAAIRYNIRLNQLIGSPAYPQDECILQLNATRYIERAHYPRGFQRQLAAIAATPNRQYLLRKIKAPTLVIHGSEDPIIPLTAGTQTALQIRNAKLKVVLGMGHDLPPALMKKMTKWIAKHVNGAELKKLTKKRKKQQEAAFNKP
ncbi:alpha/beta fold hydrolase [Pseudoalteromonas mariniglutinosa]|uniref:alpha/beta fold hydrolase n=1 Tax=Pseudoalteromonas mariniglutinosa TaxID=206042 RepID=UPI00384CFC33